jgi:hypothetical protein
LEDAYHSLEMITAIYHSSETDQPIDLPLRKTIRIIPAGRRQDTAGNFRRIPVKSEIVHCKLARSAGDGATF